MRGQKRNIIGDRGALREALIQSFAWYWIGWLANISVFQYSAWRGMGGPLGIPFQCLDVFFGVRIPIADFMPWAITQRAMYLLPFVIPAALASARIPFTFRVAMTIGVGLLTCVSVATMAHSVIVEHRGAFDAGWPYFAIRPFDTLPGPLAAAAVTALRLSKKRKPVSDGRMAGQVA